MEKTFQIVVEQLTLDEISIFVKGDFNKSDVHEGTLIALPAVPLVRLY
jgi:hypothetical protein